MRLRPILKRLQRKILRKKELWLVDDEDRWHEYIESNYAGLPDFTVRKFKKPIDVLTALDNGDRPDLLLIDIFFANDGVDPLQAHFDQELEEVGEMADKIWDKFKGVYQPEGLKLATQMEGRHIPACLYSAKGAPLFPSSTLGQLILQVMRHTKFLMKTLTPSVEEREQIVRMIDEHRAVRRKMRRLVLGSIGFVATAMTSGYVGYHWQDLGQFFRRVIDIIF